MYEYAEITGYKHSSKGTELLVTIPKKSIGDYLKRFGHNGIVKAEIRLDDGRTISNEQRKKTYAMIRDIAIHTGYVPEELKEIMKYYYIAESGEKYFSLSKCSMTTARLFINCLIEFCFAWDIPLKESAIDRTDDIGKTLWLCLKYRKCCLCGKKADIHHVDAIGRGRNRNTYDNSQHRKIALCRKHHTEAHAIGWETFSQKYHVYGILFKEDGEYGEESEESKRKAT